ncbi:MAG: hypothetical protein ACRD8Z_18630 [Nitrososphaeraceae archaeon]
MLYIVSDIHKAADCPGKDPVLMKEFATRFSEDNISSKNVKILDVYVDQSCMLQTNKDHLCLFVVEANSSANLSELFMPMKVEVRPMIKWRNFPSPRPDTFPQS